MYFIPINMHVLLIMGIGKAVSKIKYNLMVQTSEFNENTYSSGNFSPSASTISPVLGA